MGKESGRESGLGYLSEVMRVKCLVLSAGIILFVSCIIETFNFYLKSLYHTVYFYDSS